MASAQEQGERTWICERRKFGIKWHAAAITDLYRIRRGFASTPFLCALQCRQMLVRLLLKQPAESSAQREPTPRLPCIHDYTTHFSPIKTRAHLIAPESTLMTRQTPCPHGSPSCSTELALN